MTLSACRRIGLEAQLRMERLQHVYNRRQTRIDVGRLSLHPPHNGSKLPYRADNLAAQGRPLEPG
ncbi:MAG: hypothetical protein AB8H80_06555 [Planctomycetota bacterium]